MRYVGQAREHWRPDAPSLGSLHAGQKRRNPHSAGFWCICRLRIPALAFRSRRLHRALYGVDGAGWPFKPSTVSGTARHHHISGPGYLHRVLCAVLARGYRGHRGSSSGAEAVASPDPVIRPAGVMGLLKTPIPRWDGVTFAVSGSPGIYRPRNDSTPIFMAQGVFVQLLCARLCLGLCVSAPHQSGQDHPTCRRYRTAS